MEAKNMSRGSLDIAQIEQSREQMHRIIDKRYDVLVHKILTNGHELVLPEGERIMSLAADPARFKGTKPTAIRFPDGRTVSVSKWRMAVMEVLWDCNRDPAMHDGLMNLRGKVNGRLRPILAGVAVGMDVPLKIDENLYLEGKLDTEFLLKIVTNDILSSVGYDYSNVGLVIYDPKLEMTGEQNHLPVVQM